MKFVFGPVPSRRLGQSLGIDPVPSKTCNWNCVYCQLGRSKPVVNERKDYCPPEEILSEVRDALISHQPGDIDWITFVGSGETTLHASLGAMVRAVKSLTHLPVAVITNGSLLYLPEVRQALLDADAVLPTLDAGTAELYRKINRPHPQITFNRIMDGLIKFSEEYSGKLWVEVMLVHDLNDTEAALQKIAQKLNRIQPDEIHILQPTRPPAEPWVKPPDEAGLLRARAVLGDIARVIDSATGSFDLSGGESLTDAVLGIITRHPMKECELLETLAQFSPEHVLQNLQALEKSGKAQIVQRYGDRYWSAASSFYPNVDTAKRPSRSNPTLSAEKTPHKGM